jgi:hypothetical protein
MALNEFGGISAGAATNARALGGIIVNGVLGGGEGAQRTQAGPSDDGTMTRLEDAKARLQPEIERFGDGEVDCSTVLAKADEIAGQCNVQAADLRGWAQEQFRMLQIATPHSRRTGATGCADAYAGALCMGAPLTTMPQFMTEEEAERQLNARIFKAGDWGGSPCFGRFKLDGALVRLRAEDLTMFLSGHFVAVPDGKGGVKHIPAAVWWTHSASKVVFDVVRYDPEHKYTQPNEQVLNTWRGFAIQPIKGTWKKMRRHIWQVLCKRDKAGFKYLVRWMAHLVQHPGTNPEVMVVIRSDREGAGKSSLGKWLLRIFGRHGLEIADAEQVFGKFNDALDGASFVLLEEPVFPGDHKSAEMLRAVLTARTVRINPKGRPAFEIPHSVHFIMTTNGKWAIPAGAEARRFLMLDAAGDVMPRGYFDALWAEAENGGIAAMLHDLLKVDLTHFNPRNVPATSALVEQQRRSADDVTQWITDAVVNGKLVPDKNAGGFSQVLTSAELYSAYLSWSNMLGHRRPKTSREFGRALGETGLSRSAGNNPPRWTIPDALSLLAAADRRAGIRRVSR